MKRLSQKKEGLSAEDICSTAKTKVFVDFVKQATCLGFKDQPDYDQLRLTLELIIIEQNAELANQIEDEIPGRHLGDQFNLIKQQKRKYGSLEKLPMPGKF